MPDPSANLNFVTGEELEKELKVRKSPHLFQSVPNGQAEYFVGQGWEVVRTGKSTTRLSRPKAFDRALEDEAWTLLARVGFTHLSTGRQFTIPVANDGKGTASKQIDVMAVDDETALVVECKASETVGPRSLGKDLAEAHGLRESAAKAVREHFGSKRKIGVLFITRSIIWSQADRARADQFNIRVLTQDDLEYFQKLADLVGPAARHQLQAEIFGEQDIPGLDHAVPAVKGKIGGRTFYQFTIEPERLLKIGFIGHRARLDADSVGTYQRMLKKSRLKAIREYIESGGVFPTSVVVNFRTRRRFDSAGEKGDADASVGILYLPKTYKAAWIIDGQHRLYGFAGSRWATSRQLPVLAFEGLPPSEEAKLFIDINNKQVKVSRNLLVDLQSELYWDSPKPDEAYHALLSRVVAHLGRDLGSPLRGRTVLEGETQTPESPLTITGVYEAFKKSSLIGSVRKGVFHPGPLYDRDSLSSVRRSLEVLGGYLNFFAQALPEHWASGNGEGGYLCTNNGINALMLVLTEAVEHLDRHADVRPGQATPTELLSMIESFATPVIEVFRNADLTLIKSYRRQVGNAGQRGAAFAMMDAIAKQKPGFAPDGLEEYIKSQDESGTNQARVLMPEVQLAIQKLSLRLLVDAYGAGEDGWWRKGVPPNVRSEVASRREANPEGGETKDYFELLDYRSIAYANWELFAPYFSIGGSRGKDKSTEWFGKLNAIRNRIAHPERGNVSEDELAFIESIAAHLEEVRDR